MLQRFYLDIHEFGSRKFERYCVKAALIHGKIEIESIVTKSGKVICFESLSPHDQCEFLDWLSDQMLSGGN